MSADLFATIPTDVIKYFYFNFDTVTKVKMREVCKFFKNLTPVLSLWLDYNYKMNELDIKDMLDNIYYSRIILTVYAINFEIVYDNNTIYTGLSSHDLSLPFELYPYISMCYPKLTMELYVYGSTGSTHTIQNTILLPLWKKSPKINYQQVLENISFTREIFISKLPVIDYEKITNCSIDELQFLILTTVMK